MTCRYKSTIVWTGIKILKDLQESVRERHLRNHLQEVVSSPLLLQLLQVPRALQPSIQHTPPGEGATRDGAAVPGSHRHGALACVVETRWGFRSQLDTGEGARVQADLCKYRHIIFRASVPARKAKNPPWNNALCKNSKKKIIFTRKCDDLPNSHVWCIWKTVRCDLLAWWIRNWYQKRTQYQ